MKAIKLLKQSIQANLDLAEDYNKEAEFELFKKDMNAFERKKQNADRFLESAKECEEAIEEINELLKTSNMTENKNTCKCKFPFLKTKVSENGISAYCTICELEF